ncbi:hypothetical protein QN277_019049 [Acacia crassicarpa]|uniref:ent-kaurene synthase n=1 Tax=Acacia crassicarpa TaxID=499986 RepID=A0AAE1JXW5_9FABA|nr:hypothetical protein QN277_019049 [Acacia crassicarpa]
MFDKVELSLSSYDTAWVAMIPSPSSVQAPLFPQTLNWLLENQHKDGSWGLSHGNELLTKDSLLSTLASVLALKQWSVGEQQINKGLGYIESNIAAAADDKQLSSIGFDIIFTRLIEQAQSQDLNLPFRGNLLEKFFHKREVELQSGWGSNSEGWKAYVAYISEGFGKSQNWETAMKFQRKNGSLFNSPAATAAAYTHINNSHCLDYLVSLLDKFENAVPTVHPLDVYARLHMVDSLEKQGINRHFKDEIGSVLDYTWRLWQQKEDDIFLEPTTCALAFRLLRLHGYDVSSDALDRFSEDKFCNTLQGYLKDVESVLELHKASQIALDSNESVLEELNTWTRHFLQEFLSTSSKNNHKPPNHVDHEISFALRFPHHAYLDLILNRRSIEQYKVDQRRILKSSYRWFMESGMEKLNFPVSKTSVVYSFLSAAATLPSPEHGEARLAWAKHGLLTSVFDNFFDVWSNEEEQINLVKLVEKWDIDVNKESCSETMKILLLVLKRTISETATQAFKVQERSVLNHLIQQWVDILRSMLKEAEWCRSKYVPSIEEYERNGTTSAAFAPIVMSAMYLVGPKLPQAIAESSEFNHLLEVLGLYGRYLNDVNGYQREKEQGKMVNSVGLRLIHESGAVNDQEEMILKKMKKKSEEKRKELLRLVVNEEGSIASIDVRDVLWKMCRTLEVIYGKDDIIHAMDVPDEVLNIKDIVLGDPIVLG